MTLDAPQLASIHEAAHAVIGWRNHSTVAGAIAVAGNGNGVCGMLYRTTSVDHDEAERCRAAGLSAGVLTCADLDVGTLLAGMLAERRFELMRGRRCWGRSRIVEELRACERLSTPSHTDDFARVVQIHKNTHVGVDIVEYVLPIIEQISRDLRRALVWSSVEMVAQILMLEGTFEARDFERLMIISGPPRRRGFGEYAISRPR